MKLLIYIFLTFILTSCGGTKIYTEQDQQAFQSVRDMANSQNFEITSNYARPMASGAFSQVANSGVLGLGNSASNINISSNSNNLTIKGDSISGHFPFYGELQFGSGNLSSNHQGIEFDDIPDDYRIFVNDAKHRIEISFSIDDNYRNAEHYDVLITIFQNNRTNIQINSTYRSSIEYSGTVEPLREDKMVKN